MIILTDTLPDPRDVVIISLMESCRLHRNVFIHEELAHCRDRIADVGKMDFIGQSVHKVMELKESKPIEEIAHTQ
ncbi:MAG: hypothetical protein AAGF10_05465 [Verrucomicrobiota bacterium]